MHELSLSLAEKVGSSGVKTDSTKSSEENSRALRSRKFFVFSLRFFDIQVLMCGYVDGSNFIVHFVVSVHDYSGDACDMPTSEFRQAYEIRALMGLSTSRANLSLPLYYVSSSSCEDSFLDYNFGVHCLAEFFYSTAET